MGPIAGENTIEETSHLEIGARAGTRLQYLFKRAVHRMSELNRAALAPLGIDERELGILLVVADWAPLSQLEAANRLGIDRSTMVAMLDILERKGLVARRPDAEDRRRNVIALTPKGTTVMEAGTLASDAAERTLLDAFGPDNARMLREALSKIASADESAGRATT